VVAHRGRHLTLVPVVDDIGARQANGSGLDVRS
jgi:hypothetical protein